MIIKEKDLSEKIEKMYEESQERLVDRFLFIKDNLDKAFGEENNQIILNQKEVFNICKGINFSTNIEKEIKTRIGFSAYYIVIRFPEIIITNSKRTKRKIRDLFVKLSFDFDLKNATYLQGLRTTYTTEEVLGGYSHSHLPGLSTTNFNSFCLGSGPIIQVLMTLSTSFTNNNFKMLCFHIKNYVRWESIEGHPHRRINDIGSTAGLPTVNFSNDNSKKGIELLASICAKDVNLLDLITPQITDYNIIVKPTDDFETYLADKIEKIARIAQALDYRKRQQAPELYMFWGFALEYLLAFKKSDNTYYRLSADSQRANVNGVFKFKGIDFKVKIIDEEDEGKTQTKSPHPEFTKEFCRILERKFSKAAFERCSNRRTQSEVSNFEKYTTADQLVMSEDFDSGVERFSDVYAG